MNEVAWILPEGANTIRPRLTNIKRLIAVTTHGSSKLVNALQGEPGKRTISRSIRVMCNKFCRARWIALYGLDTSTLADREKHLASIGQRVARALR
jgi:putative NADPH-quinone reductase